MRARRIFDGVTMLRDSPVLVLLDGGLITDVDVTGAEPPQGVPVDDLGDGTLLPGLIDTHTHLVFDASDEVVANVQAATADELLTHMRSVAQSVLAAGITTVRDLGDRDYLSLVLREETAASADAGPRIVAAGPPLTPTGGHCWFLGGQADGPDGIKRAVDERAARGVNVVKMMTTGGRMTPTTAPHESQYTLAELRVAADRSHEHGLTIAGHAHGRQGIADAVTAGFDTLEHVTFVTPDGIEPDQRVIDAIAAAGIIASITLGMWPGAPTPAFFTPALREKALAHLKNCHDSGVRISLGPDGGIAPSKPHHVLPHGLLLMIEAGIPADVTLSAVTATAADACGLTGHAGRIAPGHDADLVAVAGDPLLDMTTMQNPVAIFRHGQRVK
ncbi:MAG: amidohydrolase family protein [Mycobacteriales bacterium]